MIVAMLLASETATSLELVGLESSPPIRWRGNAQSREGAAGSFTKLR